MPKPKSVMDVFKHLDKSNCRECGEKTCLAFAGAVFQARKDVSRCPKLDPEIVARLSGGESRSETPETMGEKQVAGLKRKIPGTDLSEAAERTGGRFNRDRLTVRIMGKDFSVDGKGNLYSGIHTFFWVAVPFLEYVLRAKGTDPSGEWVSFRDLKGADDFSHAFFKKRCESPLKQVADDHGDLFDDLVELFGGRPVEAQFDADISVVLHPLPKVPVMVCYQRPEEGFGSTLTFLFDRTVEDNLPFDSVAMLCVGFAQMLDKLSQRHSALRSAIAV